MPIHYTPPPSNCPPAYGGCLCSCHRHPGVVHIVACCWPQTPQEEPTPPEPLPPWAIRLATGSYTEIGAQLCTRDGRKSGNAVLTAVDGLVYIVTTDMGHITRLYPSELERTYYPPRYIMDVRAHERLALQRLTQAIDDVLTP